MKVSKTHTKSFNLNLSQSNCLWLRAYNFIMLCVTSKVKIIYRKKFSKLAVTQKIVTNLTTARNEFVFNLSSNQIRTNPKKI